MDKGDFSIVCAIALNRAYGNNPRFSHVLVGAFGSAEEIFALSDSDRQRLFGPYSAAIPPGKAALEAAEEEFLSLRDQGVQFTSIFGRHYPALLRECPDAPVLLYVRSSSPAEEIFGNGDCISVVGTRDPDQYGLDWCKRITRALPGGGGKERGESHADVPAVVSGLARGIDICAHRAALDNGLRTIAVSPVGIGNIYPRAHEEAAERIASSPGSAVITDYPPGTIPYPGNFLRRNRIIAGLSHSTILIQSRARGGGMMTARLASGYGRPVFALPGRIDDIRSEGCNRLIYDKVAEPVISLQSLVSQLYPGRQCRRRKNIAEKIGDIFGDTGDTGDAIRLCEMIRLERGADGDSLCEMAGMDYSRTSALLCTLENAGIIERDLIGRCSINAEFD